MSINDGPAPDVALRAPVVLSPRVELSAFIAEQDGRISDVYRLTERGPSHRRSPTR